MPAVVTPKIDQMDGRPGPSLRVGVLYGRGGARVVRCMRVEGEGGAGRAWAAVLWKRGAEREGGVREARGERGAGQVTRVEREACG